MPTSVIVQNLQFPKKDGTYPLKLRITQGDKQNYYAVIIGHNKVSFSKEDWQRINRPNPRGDLGKWKEKLQSYEKKARDVIANLEVFSFDGFKGVMVSFGFTVMLPINDELHSAIRPDVTTV